jgi:hypothetical protein
MSPTMEREIEQLKTKMETKESDCVGHKAETDELRCHLLDPENGIAVRMTRIEGKLETQGLDVADIKDTMKWAARGILAILVILVSYFASDWINRHDQQYKVQPTSQTI